MIIKKLPEICEIKTGKKDANHANKEGKYRFYTCASQYSMCDTFSFSGECVIVPGNGDIGLVFYYNGKFEAYQRTYVLCNIKINPKYLYYHMLHKWRYINSGKQFGSTVKYVRMANFTSYEIPVPPIAEQERIVARIEELFSQLDKAVETLKIIKEQLAVYQQAVLKAAFEGKLTTTHVNLDVELTWLYDEKIKQLPILPSEWRYINLSELGDLGRGKSKHRPRNAAILFENGKYPFIQTGEVKAANKYVETYSNMYGEFGLQQSKLWPKGTLCITIAANIAETAFLGMDACFPDSVVGFTANEYVFPEYVRYFIEASKIRLSAYAPATAQKNINLATLENLVVPYCALTEQKIIVQQIEERLSICDNIEKTVDVILQQTEAMRQSILKQAFEGELV